MPTLAEKEAVVLPGVHKFQLLLTERLTVIPVEVKATLHADLFLLDNHQQVRMHLSTLC